jgi:hypothetical protein
VIVFIDAQNVHQDFKRAFLPVGAPAGAGWFHPVALAELLVSKGPEFEEWRLDQVRVYAGSPVASRQPKLAAAHDRQIAAWKAAGAVPRLRPLLYPAGWPSEKPRQKGVDVELATDVVKLAIGGAYEIGIIASTDGDLIPAIEAVYELRPGEATPRICVVQYGALKKRLNLRDASGRRLYAFRMTREDYEVVKDDTDYFRAPAH